MKWHIQFTVPGSKLEVALSYIHSLSPSAMGVTPVHDGPPAPRAEVAAEARRRLAPGALRTAIMRQLLDGPISAQAAKQMARDMGGTDNSGYYKTIKRMRRDGTIRTSSTGKGTKYHLTKSGAVEARAIPRRSP